MPFMLARARPEERRPIVAVLVTIALVLIAHAILETARDAVFLTHVPATRLPWLYLGLAAIIILTRPLLGLAGGRPSRGSLVALQTLAGLGTAAFAFADTSSSVPVVYALYLWGGVAGMMILVRLWLLLSARFTASQAKRLFPYVASSAVLGGLIGYGSAGMLSARFSAHGLLMVSAAIFLLSALSSLWWPPASAVLDTQPADDDSWPPEQATPAPPMRLWESLTTVARHSYVRRVAAMMLLASVTVTLVDFIFKSVVSQSVATGHLTTFLATSYFLFDLASLLLLVTLVGPLLRRAGVARALVVRPTLVIGAAAVLTAFGGLWAVLLLRGVDGALRTSLHKTAAELLYVPMSARLRTAVKEISDVVAHRGGQALGSLIILLWLALVDNDRWMGPVIIVCAGAWIALASSLGAPYLNLFRDMLGAASATQLDFPELDIASLEATIAALSSPDDGRVIAALDLLAESGRAHLIPALILYHPAPAVVVRAFEHGAAAAREDFVPFCVRLLAHQDGGVRGAAMRTLARLGPDRERLSKASAASCPIVATTALIASAKHGWIDPTTAYDQVLQRLQGDENAAARSCVARALRDWPLPSFAPLLTELATAGDLPTRCEALHAIGALCHESHLDLIVRLLGEHDLREAARTALLAYGDPALDHLRTAWDDPTLTRAVRIHLPRTISRFPQPRVADLLLDRLLVEPSGMVRYKILRGLGRIIADNPGMQLNTGVLDRIIEQHLTNTLQLVHRRIVLEGHAGDDVPARALLLELIRQKEAFAIKRIFRVLGLRYRAEDFGRVFAGLSSRDAETRSSSRELIEHVLPPTLATAVVGLIDDLTDVDRLAAGRTYYEPEALDYKALVTALSADPNPVVSALAAHHDAEHGLGRDDDVAVAPPGGAEHLITERRQLAVGRAD